MHIAANLGPAGDWSAILSAARTADAHGFDALSFLDHYHAAKIEWPYLCGWSLPPFRCRSMSGIGPRILPPR
jgi:hypothetical protein